MNKEQKKQTLTTVGEDEQRTKITITIINEND